MGSTLSIPRATALREKALQPTDKVETIIAKSISFKSGNVKAPSRSLSFKTADEESVSSSNRPEKMVLQQSLSFKNWEPETAKLETTVSTKNQKMSQEKSEPPSTPRPLRNHKACSLQRPVDVPDLIINSPRPKSELDAAAVKLQKVYKSYRTRRNLADCAVVVEELWWKALDFAALEQSSVLFFNIQKSESAVSRWARARTRVAKVGKGLSKDEKAQKLALQHWLEAIDPRHRYGHNLHLYYDVWFDSESTQPFFYWLDVGDGKEVNLERCPRSRLQHQCIQYLGPNEREAFEVIIKDGKLVYKQSEEHVNTVEGSKWIFVLSTSRSLYVGQKKKGKFQHSSFLAGGATTAAGRLVAEQGDLKAIWPYSGHYLPTEENFKEFIVYLEEHDVDLSNVKRCATDDDYLSVAGSQEGCRATSDDVVEPVPCTANKPVEEEIVNGLEQDNEPRFQLGKPLSCKWSTGAGPRIGCVRDYPSELQFRALETVNLSPRTTPAACAPIPSPRPSPKVRLSPRLSYMGLPSPRVHTGPRVLPSPRVFPSPRVVTLQKAK